MAVLLKKQQLFFCVTCRAYVLPVIISKIPLCEELADCLRVSTSVSFSELGCLMLQTDDDGARAKIEHRIKRREVIRLEHGVESIGYNYSSLLTCQWCLIQKCDNCLSNVKAQKHQRISWGQGSRFKWGAAVLIWSGGVW